MPHASVGGHLTTNFMLVERGGRCGAVEEGSARVSFHGLVHATGDREGSKTIARVSVPASGAAVIRAVKRIE